MKLKIAITGTNGHVGSNLCRQLIPLGHEIKSLVYKDDRSLANLNITKIYGNILDPDSLRNLIKDSDIVIHLAATISISGDKSGMVYKTNVLGTQNVVNICLETGIKRLIHFSSIHAFQQYPYDKELNESRTCVDQSAYGYDLSKAKAEAIVLDGVSKGLNAIILNPTSIIGPYDFKPSFMGQALLKIFNRKLPMLVPGGYDWVDVRDVCNATIAAIDKGVSGEKYILSGSWKSIYDICRLIESILQLKSPKYICPTGLAKFSIPFINMFQKNNNDNPPIYTKDSLDILLKNNKNISSNKAKIELGFSNRDIENTLIDTYQWFKENNFIK